MEKFNEYQQKAMKTRLDECKNIECMVCGLCSEAGEVAGAHKKFIRGDYDKANAISELVKEMGDVLWYLAGLAEEIGYSLQEIAQINIDKLSSRKERGVIKGKGDQR